MLIMRDEKEAEAIKAVKEKLKECKPEWLEKNAKNQDSLGILTVQQILDYATEGVTTWDFVIVEQWREEVNKFDKRSGAWMFDGYVYHVRGYLHIEGLGQRAQYGSKVAIGGKDNQNSSYKSAASDCLKKCASLFGVGASIYSRIKIETEEQTYTSHQQADTNSQVVVHMQPQQVTLANGDVQQGEWIWSNNSWVHQSEYQPAQGGQYPRLTNEQQQTQEAIQYADQHVQNTQVEYPFENVQPQEPTVQQQNFQAQPQQEAEPQAAAEQQNFEAVQYGAPIANNTPEPSVEVKVEVEPQANVVVDNPWAAAQGELDIFRQHKGRLSIANDSDLVPHVREYFKDATATIGSITPETLKGFNVYLQNIQV